MFKPIEGWCGGLGSGDPHDPPMGLNELFNLIVPRFDPKSLAFSGKSRDDNAEKHIQAYCRSKEGTWRSPTPHHSSMGLNVLFSLNIPRFDRKSVSFCVKSRDDKAGEHIQAPH
jgi:hypothetical protein